MEGWKFLFQFSITCPAENDEKNLRGFFGGNGGKCARKKRIGSAFPVDKPGK
jgi:hypothetical protein